MRSTISVHQRENFYLILKEAVTNIAKHSTATQATIDIRNGKETLEIIVADNGKGWEEGSPAGGHGLRNMKMRAERLGGTLHIEHDGGTRVVLTAPPL
jgi:signal transduction histidine kinase